MFFKTLAQLILNAPSKLSGVLQLKGNADFQASCLSPISRISIQCDVPKPCLKPVLEQGNIDFYPPCSPHCPGSPSLRLMTTKSHCPRTKCTQTDLGHQWEGLGLALSVLYPTFNSCPTSLPSPKSNHCPSPVNASKAQTPLSTTLFPRRSKSNPSCPTPKPSWLLILIGSFLSQSHFC